MSVDTTDELFIDAPVAVVHRALLQLGAEGEWWPRGRAQAGGGLLTMRAPVSRTSRVRFSARISNIRPTEGLTWRFEGGELRGVGEWWLEPFKNGTMVHYYLNVERGDRARLRRMSSLVRRHRWAIRRGVNGLKDTLENRARV